MSFAIRFPVVAVAGALCSVAVSAVAVPAFAQAADPARAQVQMLDDGLIAIMKGGSSLGTAGRTAKIGPIVDQTFDCVISVPLRDVQNLSQAYAKPARAGAAFRTM